MEGYDVDSSKFPLTLEHRLMSPIELQEQQEGGEVKNGIVYNLEGCFLHMALHTSTNNIFPKNFRKVVNLFGLVVYKGSKHKGE